LTWPTIRQASLNVRGPSPLGVKGVPSFSTRRWREALVLKIKRAKLAEYL